MTGFKFLPERYPTTPGCYIMKNMEGVVIYVGKAKNLRRRLASYFREKQKYWKVQKLAPQIHDIEVILVNTEVESLVLENNLIKHYRPRFNTFLVGEKSGYPYILLTHEEFPRLVPYKKNLMNKALKGLNAEECERRFGPYLSYNFREELQEYAAEKYRLRVCDPLPRKACLLYHIKKCSAPCEGRIGREAYTHQVQAAAEFLSQPNRELIQQMKEHMLECSERLEFERANRIKEQLTALELGMEKQIVERDIDFDQEVFYFGDRYLLSATIRAGILLGMHFTGLPQGAAGQFLLEHSIRVSPDEIIANRLEDPVGIQAALSTAVHHPVRIIIPTSGVEFELLKLCEMNYTYRLDKEHENDEHRDC